MIFLSLGAGVQSSVMLMRAIAGDIERPDHVIFADTGWEPRAVYDHLAWLAKQCEKARLPLHLVSNGNIRHDMVVSRTAGKERVGRWASMPLFVVGEGIDGMIRRQCTKEYKLTPLRRKQRELLGYQPRQRIPAGAAITYIGISTDEARRASPSGDSWNENEYPLIDPLKMSRDDCRSWWDQHYPHRTLPKSACIGCPFRSRAQWMDMAKNRPDEFADAVLFDAQIRDAAGMRGKSYVHVSRVPLSDIDFEDQPGLDLEDGVYCAGGCGL